MIRKLNSLDTLGLKFKWLSVGGIEEKWGKVSVRWYEIYSRNLLYNFVPILMYSVFVNLFLL